MSKLGLSYIGWDTKTHMQAFNVWNNQSDLNFNFNYGSFAEQKYLLESVKLLNKPRIVDIGCATGTTYRFLNNKLGSSNYSYKGIDLSKSAIDRARSLYPGVDFLISNGERPHKTIGLKADIVFSRDTILHQENPYDFLDQLMEITERFLIIRLRTRDHGETEFDISKSCQMHYDKFWMPYIVLNTDELISYFKNNDNVVKVTINRSYEVLGGANFRFLPKDLYEERARGAETSIIVELGSMKKEGEIEIVYDNSIQGRQFLKQNRWNFKYLIYRLISKLRNLS